MFITAVCVIFLIMLLIIIVGDGRNKSNKILVFIEMGNCKLNEANTCKVKFD